MPEPLSQHTLDPVAINSALKNALRNNETKPGLARDTAAKQNRNSVTAQQFAAPQYSHKIVGAQSVLLVKC